MYTGVEKSDHGLLGGEGLGWGSTLGRGTCLKQRTEERWERMWHRYGTGEQLVQPGRRLERNKWN